ncbi:MAG: glycosyltransferase family 2 protein [Lactobacillaceae bacterium]|nr:glycosyltransferase family 2 protein [Lactobacillaceae bacterium]
MKLSVIIPVYNSGRYLERCLSSVIKQSFNDFEVIIVDDGSTDNSKSVIEKYLCEDKRIKYYFVEHTGVSNARNYGISKVGGEYLMFLDADDYCNNDYFENMVFLIESLNVDIVMCNYYVVRNGNAYINKLPRIYDDNGTLDTESAIGSILLDNGFKGFVWNKIYNMTAIGLHRFDANITYLEDLLFNICVIKDCKKIGYSNGKSYYYTQNNESASSQLNQDFYSALLTIRDLVSLNNRYVVDSSMLYALILSGDTKSKVFKMIKSENKIMDLRLYNPVKNLIIKIGLLNPGFATLLARNFKMILVSRTYVWIRKII